MLLNKLLSFVSLVLLTSAAASAQTPASTPHDQKLIRVTAEHFPGQEFFVHILSDDQNKILGMIYENPQEPIKEKVMRHISIDQLSKGYTLFSVQGYDMVKLVAELNADHTGADVSVLYRKFAPKSKYTTYEVSVKFNPQMQVFEMSDADSGQVFHDLYAPKNKVLGKEIGIKSLETN